MEINVIKSKLTENHTLFVDEIMRLTNDELLKNKNNKWNAAQQLQHIYLSVKPVRQIVNLPKFLPKILWGKANRKSKTYNELIKKYLIKLENGGRATNRFIPKQITTSKAQQLKIKLMREILALCASLDKFNEKELDEYILPHPLLGRLTVREMMYFTIYHVEHHMNLVKKNLD